MYHIKHTNKQYLFFQYAICKKLFSMILIKGIQVSGFSINIKIDFTTFVKRPFNKRSIVF